MIIIDYILITIILISIIILFILSIIFLYEGVKLVYEEGDENE